MKIINQYKYLIVVVGVSLITACGKTASTEQKAEEPHDEENTIEITPAQMKAINIAFGNFEKKNLSEVITANGYTKLPPQNQADVSVFLGGIVKTIGVIEGQFVKKGQILATFQSLEFNNLRLEKTKLTEELQQAKVSKEFLDLDFARQKELSDENITAKKAFQKVSSELELVKSKILNTENQIKILEQNIAMSGSETSNNLAVFAPISGYITAVNIKIGSNIKSDNVLFSIVDNAEMHVDLLVYEKDLFRIKVGQNVRFVLTNQGNQEIIGQIFSVGKAFQNESKSVAVHADINNRTAGLISGMYVNALIDIGKNEVETLPIDAVAKADGKEYIFIQQSAVGSQRSAENKKSESMGIHFKRIEVKTGTTQLGFIQVTALQDIQTGAKIVVKGAYYLQSAMSNSEGGEEH